MRIILAETHYWESAPRVDSHHLATRLARRGNDILYLSSPISLLHFLQPRAWGHKWRRLWRYGGDGLTPQPRIRCVVPLTWAPLRAPAIVRDGDPLRRSLDWTTPSLARLIGKSGFGSPAALVIQSLFFARMPALLPRGIPLIYRMTDDMSAFPGIPREMREAEPGLVRAADVVTASSRLLAERAGRMGARRVEALPHGVDLLDFQDAAAKAMPRKNIAAYVGAIDSWFDADLVAAAAKGLPDWEFQLAGPVGAPDLSPLRGLANVSLIGPIRYSQVPGFLSKARIGLIPFRRIPLIEAVHPIKLYEYLAAGLAVVSSRWDEIERIQAPILLADGPEEFAAQTVRAAAGGASPATKEFVSHNTWDSRAALLEELIRKLRPCSSL